MLKLLKQGTKSTARDKTYKNKSIATFGVCNRYIMWEHMVIIRISVE